ncbi:hypothetical protein [Shewanella sp.]|uniref:hypothetical protein n=1 Tax=Shewanella sp. TaxID=50422 RepID=UPI001EC90089|nr:hypothetical protein [Shewanella sp.]NRB23800.1 hypothetical protein [Shewanella sp.]
MFKAAKLKIERAQKHINDLNDLCSTYVNSDFCKIWVEKDSKNGDYLFRLSQTKKPPSDIPLIIGDAVHNLRSAIDIAYCELIRDIAGIGLRPKTQVKIVKTRNELISGLTKGDGILKSKPAIAEVVANILRPYVTDNEASLIHIIHELNIIDKHIILIPVFCPSKAVITNIKMGGLTIGRLEAEINHNGVLNIARMAGGEIDFQFDSHSVSFSVLFGNGQPLEGEPVVLSLQKLLHFTAEIINNLEVAVNDIAEIPHLI